jgi:hypothetical protein
LRSCERSFYFAREHLNIGFDENAFVSARDSADFQTAEDEFTPPVLRVQ